MITLSTPTAPLKITAFTDLKAWQESHKLVLSIYMVTKDFPSEEKFELTRQLRRACVSITSNIAEGFRRISGKDKANFYTIALGSLTEVENQLIIAKDIGYLDAHTYDEITSQAVSASKLIRALLKKTQNWPK